MRAKFHDILKAIVKWARSKQFLPPLGLQLMALSVLHPSPDELNQKTIALFTGYFVRCCVFNDLKCFH